MHFGELATLMAKRDPRLKRLGLKGFNKPKRTPGHPTKSHVVLAKEDPKPKLFGLANKEYPELSLIHI